MMIFRMVRLKRVWTMGKHIKTKLDYDIINQLARELYAIEPGNEVLGKFLAMDNFEGAELRKAIADVVPSKEFGVLCTDCRGG